MVTVSAEIEKIKRAVEVGHARILAYFKNKDQAAFELLKDLFLSYWLLHEYDRGVLISEGAFQDRIRELEAKIAELEKR